MTKDISLQTLLPYTDFMTDEEVIRFEDYLGNKEPLEPFTLQEIAELEEKKEKHFQKIKQFQDEILEKYLNEVVNQQDSQFF